MALTPELRALVKKTNAKYRNESAIGIIPYEPLDISDREMLINDVAVLITDAMTQPAVSAWEVAKVIVDTVQERLIDE